MSYQVGAGAPFGGRLLAVWQHTLAVGCPLPTIPLAVSLDEPIPVDLEFT